MSESEFFSGERLVDSFSVELHAGKARLNCAIMERWQEVCTLSLSCGTVHERVLTQRFGVGSTEHEDLETTIKGSLGLKGIAQFQSEVKAKAGREIRLERSRETSEKFTFKAPDCGRLIKGLFQLTRQYWLTYEDSRFFSKGSWTKVVTQWLNRIHDTSKQIEDDPDCGCKSKSKSGSEGLIEILAGKKIGILASYFVEEKRVRLPILNHVFESVSVDDLMFSFLDVSRQNFPRYLRFLARENSPRIRCAFQPYTDVRRTIWSSSFQSGMFEPTFPLKVTEPEKDYAWRKERELLERMDKLRTKARHIVPFEEPLEEVSTVEAEEPGQSKKTEGE